MPQDGVHSLHINTGDCTSQFTVPILFTTLRYCRQQLLTVQSQTLAPQGQEILLFPRNRLYQPWGPTSLTLNDSRDSFLAIKLLRHLGVKLMTHLPLVYKLRMCRAIQGDSGGICNTLGNHSMCDSKQKSSYEHGSDFERLPRYGKKKIRTILRARTAIT